MSTFIYFPCDSKGNLMKGFCPTVADGNSLFRDVYTWKKVKKQFKLTHYAFRLCVGNDYNINPSGLSICKL